MDKLCKKCINPISHDPYFQKTACDRCIKGLHNPTIITISGKARNGKDESAKILKSLLELQNQRVLHIAYADYVKFTAQRYLGWDGLKDEAGRSFLQSYGTEEVRSADENFWVDTVIRFVNVLKNRFDFVVISDCRFQNEINLWKENNYDVISIRVNRMRFDSELNDQQKAHLSETALDDYKFDINISASTLEELQKVIVEKVIPELPRLAVANAE